MFRSISSGVEIPQVKRSDGYSSGVPPPDGSQPLNCFLHHAAIRLPQPTRSWPTRWRSSRCLNVNELIGSRHASASASGIFADDYSRLQATARSCSRESFGFNGC